jgi:hypothetical protein
VISPPCSFVAHGDSTSSFVPFPAALQHCPKTLCYTASTCRSTVLWFVSEAQTATLIGLIPFSRSNKTVEGADWGGTARSTTMVSGVVIGWQWEHFPPRILAPSLAHFVALQLQASARALATGRLDDPPKPISVYRERHLEFVRRCWQQEPVDEKGECRQVGKSGAITPASYSAAQMRECENEVAYMICEIAYTMATAYLLQLIPWR